MPLASAHTDTIAQADATDTQTHSCTYMCTRAHTFPSSLPLSLSPLSPLSVPAGVILYMMLTGELPFQGHDDYTTVMKIMDTAYEQPQNVSGECLELLASLLSKESCDRISMERVLKHTWLSCGSAKGSVPEPVNERPKLSPDQHERITRIMEEAGITRDAIAKSISANSYDYVASTYFLLADKELRRHAKSQEKKKAGEPLIPCSPVQCSAGSCPFSPLIMPARAHPFPNTQQTNQHPITAKKLRLKRQTRMRLFVFDEQ